MEVFFKILGSSSSGNSAVLRVGEKTILIDAGLSCKKLQLLLGNEGIALEELDIWLSILGPRWFFGRYTSNWPASRRARPSTNYMLPSMVFDDFERILHPWREQSNTGNDKNERVFMHFRTSADGVRF